MSEEKELPKENQFDIGQLLGSDTLSWITGDLQKPADLKQLGDDLTIKMNWYIACTILAQYSRIPALFDTLNKLQAKLADKEVIDKLKDVRTISDMYSSTSKEIQQITEFARKFVVQNKEELADNASFFDQSLFKKIQSLGTDQVRDYLDFFQIVDRKGSTWLKDIIAEHKKT